MDVRLAGSTSPGAPDGRTGSTDARPGEAAGAVWDPAGPAPGSAGTAMLSGDLPRLTEVRRGQTIEVPRADRRTAVFTVYRVSPAGVSGRGEPSSRARIRLVSGETAVLARLTGHRRAPR